MDSINFFGEIFGMKGVRARGWRGQWFHCLLFFFVDNIQGYLCGGLLCVSHCGRLLATSVILICNFDGLLASFSLVTLTLSFRRCRLGHY